jgi:lipopolysaccharide export system protein LptA
MHVEGDKAVGYFDENNQIQRAVVTGNPARFHQTLDDNSLVHGSASNIDYQVSENTVILTGNAVVVHEGQGDFHGAKLTYNTDTGSINGMGGPGGQVHMTLVPKPKAAKPSASKTAAPASAKPAGAAASAPANANAPASTPAPASTSGTH